MLKRIGAMTPEVGHVLYPDTFKIMMHPLTPLLLEKVPELSQLLADMSAKEMVGRLSRMDAEDKLIDLGLVSGAKDAQKENEKDNDEGE